ncbi:MAG: hypothetical protein ACREJS_06705 [Candidatus Rokuibacteriota bacterium]
MLDAFAFWTDEELHALVDRYVGPDTLFVGFSTTLMEPRVTHEDEAHVPEQARARTMGLARSSIFSRSDESMRGLVARIRARNPQARIVVGGPRVEWERAHDFVDYWVVGAGDHGLDIARLPGFGIQSSKMDEDPGRYGYTMRGKGYWTRGDGLTVAEARRVAHELNERSTNANPAARSFVGRYVNLGYTFQDLVGRRVTDAAFLADVRRRKTLVRSQYKTQVLAGGD